MNDFTEDIDDSSPADVSVEKARSLAGHVGMALEAAAGGWRLSGSVDMTREFSGETEAVISGSSRKASAVPMGVRFGLGAAYGWGDGRYALRGSADYTETGGGNSAYGGGLNLTVSF